MRDRNILRTFGFAGTGIGTVTETKFIHFGNHGFCTLSSFYPTLWQQGKLVGKVGSVFASTATQHGGQETTLTSFHTTLFHHGMIVVGVPYACAGLTNMDEISGGTPYGATTLSKGDGSRQPSANELDIARYQGKHVAEITKKMFG